MLIFVTHNSIFIQAIYLENLMIQRSLINSIDNQLLLLFFKRSGHEHKDNIQIFMVILLFSFPCFLLFCFILTYFRKPIKISYFLFFINLIHETTVNSLKMFSSDLFYNSSIHYIYYLF